MSAVGKCNCMVVFLCRYVHMLSTYHIAELGELTKRPIPRTIPYYRKVCPLIVVSLPTSDFSSTTEKNVSSNYHLSA